MDYKERDAVIVSAVRTPIGKYGGRLAPVKDYELGGAVIREAVKRAGVHAAEIDDVYFGNLLGLPGNVAKVAAMEAGIPENVPAVTVDRQCASGLESAAIAAAMIKSGMGDIYIAGGCESMSNKPYYLSKSIKPYAPKPPVFLDSMFVPPEKYPALSMGDTAENIAAEAAFTREDLDTYACRSHKLALQAWDNGYFNEEITAIPVCTAKDNYVFDKDESIREAISMEALLRLKPCFKKEGMVTAGNSCPMNDGASAMVIMSGGKAREMGIAPLVKIKAFAAAGVDYKKMGLGPINAVRKLLKSCEVSLADIGLIELNEAFAVQTLACIRELQLNPEIVNVNGGAIALGHPLGATGAVLITKIIYEMIRRNERYGLVTMCIGGGQGMAMLLER